MPTSLGAILVVLSAIGFASCGGDSPSTVPPPPPAPPPIPRPPALEVKSCGPLAARLHFTAVSGGAFYRFERRYGETGPWRHLVTLDGRLLDFHEQGPSGPIYLYEDFEPFAALVKTSIWYRVRAELDDGRSTGWSQVWGCEKAVTTDFRFEKQFWGELAFDAYECPFASSCPNYYESGASIPPLEDRRLYVLASQPDFHIRTHDDTGKRQLSSAEVRAIRAKIPEAVAGFTGESWRGRITSGPEDVRRRGWVTIRASGEQDDPERWETDGDFFTCGRALTGAETGAIWLNSDRISLSSARNKCRLDTLIAHETGHALGFFHVAGERDVMAQFVGLEHLSAREEYHAQLAYEVGRGTRYADGPQMTATANGSAPGRAPVEPVFAQCLGPQF